jgi:hypothetical protein
VIAGVTITIPSINLDLDCPLIVFRSKKYLPGLKLEVLAEVMDIVISPLDGSDTTHVKEAYAF